MKVVIDDILNENIAYYFNLKHTLVTRLLINERGYVIKKQLGNKNYVYLRKKIFGKFIERYIGHVNALRCQEIERSVEQSKKDLNELRKVKYALKRLKAKNMNYEDFTESIKEIFKLMEGEGLWDEGLELVGSWCFKIYQNYLGVEHYPERTVDIDFAIELPYKGEPLKIGKKLEELGFREQRNYSDSTISYVAGEFKVEFLKDKKGSEPKERNPYIKELDIAPVALPYLKILLDNPVTLNLRDLGKVKVPSMSAFLVHKLIVADRRSNTAKKEKDFRQAYYVARNIIQKPEELDNTSKVIQNLHKKRRDKMFKSSKEADKYISNASKTFKEIWYQLGY
mgnify:CR=1 FL=1